MPQTANRLADEQIRQLIVAFHKYDVDKDGQLNFNEVIQLLQELEAPMEEAELDDLVRDLGIDRDGVDKTSALQIFKAVIYQKNSKSPPAMNFKSLSRAMSGVTAQGMANAVGNWLVPTKEVDSAWNRGASTEARLMTEKNDRKDTVIEVDGDSDSDYEYYTYSSDSENESSYATSARKSISRRVSQSSDARRSLAIPPAADIVSHENLEKQKKRLTLAAESLEKEHKKAREEIGQVQKHKRHLGKMRAEISNKKYKNEQEKKKAMDRENVIRSKLTDPKVRKQLKDVKTYKPFFFQAISLLQIVMMAVTLIVQNGVAPIEENPLIGPSANTLIKCGAKYGECMRYTGISDYNISLAQCEVTTPKTCESINNSTTCTCKYYENLAQICGLGGFTSPNRPDQWYRFLLPLILHSGLLHLGVNLLIQVTLGYRMEASIGSTRMGIIWFVSGLSGIVFASFTEPNTVAVGSSGAVYGLFAVLYLDLFQSWPILDNPKRDTLLLTLGVIFALAIGFLPYIDNYSHIGGFIGGLLIGIVVMPQISFGRWDRKLKWIMIAIAFPLLITLFAVGFNAFYSGTPGCQWCRYLNCFPPDMGWCNNS